MILFFSACRATVLHNTIWLCTFHNLWRFNCEDWCRMCAIKMCIDEKCVGDRDDILDANNWNVYVMFMCEKIQKKTLYGRKWWEKKKKKRKNCIILSDRNILCVCTAFFWTPLCSWYLYLCFHNCYIKTSLS